MSRDFAVLARRTPTTLGQALGVPLELTVVVLVGTSLRLYKLGDESLWLDEAITVSVTREMGWWELLTQFPLADPHPPLYYLVVRLWVSLGGTAEWAVRFPSALAGIAAIPLLYGLTARLFDRWTAALAAAFFAVAPFQIWYAQEARMYALTVFLCVTSFYTLVRVLETDSRYWLVGYVFSTVLFGYTHVFALFVITAQTVFLTWHSAGIWLRHAVDRSTSSAVSDETACSGLEPDEGDRASLHVPLGRWASAQGAIVGLLSPWLAVLVWRTVLAGGEGVSIVDWIPRPTPEHIWQLYTLFTFGYAQGEVPYWSLSSPPRVLLAIAAVCLLFAVFRPAFLLRSDPLGSAGLPTRGDSQTDEYDATTEGSRTPGWNRPDSRDVTAVGLLLAWLFVPIVIAVAVSIAVTPVFVHRNLIVAAPALLLLLAHGVRALPPLPLRYLVAVLLVAGMLVPLPGYYAEEQKESWDDAAAYVDAHATANDIVLVTPTYLDYPFLYYFDEDRVPVRDVPPSIQADDLAEQLRARETVFVVTATHIPEQDRTQVLRRVQSARGVHVTDSREFDTIFVYRLASNSVEK